MNKRGVVLILGFMVIGVLLTLGASLISRSISESRIAQRYKESTAAFWLAEAGINRALNELRSNFNVRGTDLWSASLGAGRYSVDVEDVIINGQSNKKVTSFGFIPDTAPARAQRIVEATMSKYIPSNFYDNALYSAQDVDLNGNSYSVTGNVTYANKIDYSQNNINGTITQDASISPLALLDSQQLLNISQSQQNVYVQSDSKLVNQATGSESFPNSFWIAVPRDGIDNDKNGQVDESGEPEPNVVYVQSDLVLKGDIGTIGGFFVVRGDVITNPARTYDATINGNGQIEGVIYTRGVFEVNGGGGGLNVNGGVWVGGETELNGNTHVAYNQTYMQAIKALNINPQAQIVSWRDRQNPYPVSP